MICSEFLGRFSEFYDGEMDSEDAEPFHQHLRSCESCRRYRHVVERGREVLRSTPARLAPSFRQRLQHSIFLLEEERRRRRIPGSGGGMTTFALVAAVAAAVLMAPLVWDGDSNVQLPAIVVQEPTDFRLAADFPFAPVSSAAGSATQPTLGSQRSSPAVTFEEPELWSQSNALLYRYSSLYLKHREAAVIRAGLR